MPTRLRRNVTVTFRNALRCCSCVTVTIKVANVP
jgi:hypothetical protein